MNDDQGNVRLGGFLMVVLAAVMLGLVVVLGNECGAVGDELEAWRARVRAGEEVSAEVGGDEAAALTAALRAADHVTVRNFIGQAGTSCVAAWIVGSEGSVSADVLIADGEPRRILRATLTRGCTCPIDEGQPCRLP